MSLNRLIQILSVAFLYLNEGTLHILKVKLGEKEMKKIGMHFLLALEDVLAETIQL